MVTWEQYNRTEEEHAEYAVAFADVSDEFMHKNKLNRQQMIVLLNDTITYYELDIKGSGQVNE